MAKKQNKKKNNKVDPNLIDYYALYNLVRGKDRIELLAQLRNKQGEIKQMMSAGALNGSEIMEALMEQDKMVTAAIKVFKSDEALDQYNKQLDAAIAAGIIDTAAQEAAQEALSEIERLFLKGNYQAVIKRCKTVLNENGANASLYNWLAQSYYMTNQGEEALKTVNEFVRNYPEDSSALDMGVRYSILIHNDIRAAQQFLNKILEYFQGLPLAVVDQIYIHLAERNTEMAFQEADNYILENPTDQEFRKHVAYDMIGFCSRLYVMGNYEGSDVSFLTSPEDCDLCRLLSDKAMSIYQDETIMMYSDYTKHMGETEFNTDNLSNIKWTGIATLLYSYVAFSTGMGAGKIIIIALAVLCLGLTVMLLKVSKRPYWQIYKYEVTGEREPMEQTMIFIGNIVAGYMRWCFKAAWAVFRFAFAIFESA